MKILHLGLCVNPNGYSSFPHAFKQVVGEENYRELPPNHPNFNTEAVLLCNSFKPDIVFMQIQTENVISKAACEQMKSTGAFVINWTGDKRNIVPTWMVDLAPFVSLTAFSNMDDVNTMRALGFKSEYLEIGYDETIYTPIGEAYNVPEIVFMGNNYGHGYFPMSSFRIQMVEFLTKEYGNHFGVYGNGWQNAKGNVNGSQIEEAKHYRGAKIAINVSHFDSLNYNSDRLLRILGSGCLCLSYNHLGMKQTYNNSVDYFKDFTELKTKIDFYLSNKINKDIISGIGNDFVLNTFTFKHQVENIINLAL